MALADILLMSDTDVKLPQMDVGSVVIPKMTAKPDPAPATNPNIIKPNVVRTGLLIGPEVINQDRRVFGHAVVVSMNPFILVSERGDMRWESTVTQADFVAVGKVRPDVLAICNTRLAG